MKKGITLLTVVITVLIMSILVGVTVDYSLDTIKASKMGEFALEIIDIQNKVDRYYIDYNQYPVSTEVKFGLQGMSSFEISQFAGEEIVNDNVTLYYLDYTKLGITKRIFGNNNTSLDAYAVSQVTGKVYYLQGIEQEGERHYTINEKLNKDYVEGLIDSSYNDIRINDVIFKVSSTVETNNPVTLIAVLPAEANIISASATNSILVGEQTRDGDDILIPINTNNANGNYGVNITYTLNGEEKSASYNVQNFDNVGPDISITSKSNGNYITLEIDVTDTDNVVSKIKYEEAAIVDEQYFVNYGKTLKNKTINCSENKTYTFYAIDSAGNVTMKQHKVERE